MGQIDLFINFEIILNFINTLALKTLQDIATKYEVFTRIKWLYTLWIHELIKKIETATKYEWFTCLKWLCSFYIRGALDVTVKNRIGNLSSSPRWGRFPSRLFLYE